MDGVGEWQRPRCHRRESPLETVRRVPLAASLGLLLLGLHLLHWLQFNFRRVQGDGLAPYGEPKYASLILDTS